MDWSAGWNPNANDWSMGYQDPAATQDMGAIGVEPLYPTPVHQNAEESFPEQFGPGGFGSAQAPPRSPGLPAAGVYRGSGGYIYALRSDRAVQIAPGSPRGVGATVAPGSQHYDSIIRDLAANGWTPASSDPMETYDPFAPSEPREKVPWWKAVAGAFKDIQVEDVARAMQAASPQAMARLPNMTPSVADQQMETAAATLASKRMAWTLGLSAVGLVAIGVGVWLVSRGGE